MALDRAMLRETFRRITAGGLPVVALYGARPIPGTLGSLRGDVSGGLYGRSDGYKVSLMTAYADDLPGKDAELTIDGVGYVVIGREVFSGVSARLDLREAV